MDKKTMDEMVKIIEHDRDVKRARVFLALEIGHKRALAKQKAEA